MAKSEKCQSFNSRVTREMFQVQASRVEELSTGQTGERTRSISRSMSRRSSSMRCTTYGRVPVSSTSFVGRTATSSPSWPLITAIIVLLTLLGTCLQPSEALPDVIRIGNVNLVLSLAPTTSRRARVVFYYYPREELTKRKSGGDEDEERFRCVTGWVAERVFILVYVVCDISFGVCFVQRGRWGSSAGRVGGQGETGVQRWFNGSTLGERACSD